MNAYEEENGSTELFYFFQLQDGALPSDVKKSKNHAETTSADAKN